MIYENGKMTERISKKQIVPVKVKDFQTIPNETKGKKRAQYIIGII